MFHVKRSALWALLGLLTLGAGPAPPASWHRVTWTLYRPAWEAGESCEVGAGAVVALIPDLLEVQTRALADTAWTPAGDWPVQDGTGTAWVAVQGRAWVRARSIVTMAGRWTTTVPPRGAGSWRLPGCWSPPRVLDGPGAATPPPGNVLQLQHLGGDTD